jgi:hypothetical protein
MGISTPGHACLYHARRLKVARGALDGAHEAGLSIPAGECSSTELDP